MSLDIAVALAYLTNRVLVPYRFRLPRTSPENLKPGRWRDSLTLPDLFEIPVPWSKECLLKTWISVDDKLDCTWQPVYESVFCFPAFLSSGSDRFQHFRNGRQYIYRLDERQNEAPDLHINTHALGNYSHFFYLDEDRHQQLIKVMKRLRPKRPYRHVSERIAAALGNFNAIHIRRGDFVRNELSKKKITRAASIGGDEIVANLASRMSCDDPLVICTDGDPREEIFGPIKNYFREVVFLDSYLRESANIREMISELPRSDPAVFVLLTQLVASKARVFAGTLFSTFTALIHRLRGFDNGKSEFLYCYNDFASPLVRFERCEFLPVEDGQYTWNRIRYPISPGAYSWFREWPEAFEAL